MPLGEILRSIQSDVRNRLLDLLPQHPAKLIGMRRVLRQILHRQFGCFAETYDTGRVLRTRALFLLLRAAMYETRDVDPGSLIQSADTLGP